jgi:replicative DNA helicase
VDNKLPISDIKAEKGFVGSLLYDARVIDEIDIHEDAFYLADLGVVVKLVRKKRELGQAIDILTLASDLKPLGSSSETEWDRLLAECIDIAQHPGNAAYYASTIKERWVRRTACYQANQLQRDLYESPDVGAVLGRHLEEVNKLAEAGDSEDGTDCTTGLLRVLDGWKNPNSQGISTGYPDLDRYIGGWQDQRLYIIGAKTSIGKSALAINFATNVAKYHPVLFLSLEMPEDEVFTRVASSVLRKKSEDMRGTVFVEQDTSELSEGFNRAGQLKIRVDDRGGRTIASITSQARRHHRKHGLRLLVVDYLGLVEPPDRRVSRYDQLGAISRGLKLIAKNLKIPVIALSQLNRKADEEGVRPQLHHLRESGNLEQDADVVLLIHRGREDVKTELIIPKNRSGKIGVVELEWNSDIVRYDSSSWKNAETYNPMDEKWEQP